MTSAGHHIMMQGAAPVGPSARDYPQQGLVRLWDAIENAGWGTHAADPRSWLDCIAGATMDTSVYPLQFTLPQFLGNKVAFNGTDNGLSAANPLTQSTDFTIQLPLSTQNGTCTYWVPFTTLSGNSYERIQANMEGTPRVHIVMWGGVLTVNVGTQTLADKTGTLTLIWTASGEKLVVWFRGTRKGQMNMSSSTASSLIFVRPYLNIGGDPQGDWENSFFCGDIFGLRIYNRALTDAEIVQSAQ